VLNFPNQSRVFDRTRNAVHFWGHDSAMEWSFFIGEDALKRFQPDMLSDETAFLDAFDSHRASIYVMAKNAYQRERKGSYELVRTDF
jgi:Protein of unknown function (DUF1488)